MLRMQADALQQLAALALDLIAAHAAQSQRRRQDLAHTFARVQRRLRVLEDHLHLPANRLQRPSRALGDVGRRGTGSSRRSPGAAAPVSGSGSSCRSPTLRRRRASRRRGRDSETSSTACTWATVRSMINPDLIGNSTFRWSTVTAAVWTSATRPRARGQGQSRRPTRRGPVKGSPGVGAHEITRAERRGRSHHRRPEACASGSELEPAAVEVLGCVRQPRTQRRRLQTLLERVRAPRPEMAALRRREQRRWQPGDRRQPGAAVTIDPCDRPKQPPGVGMLWVVEELIQRALLDHAPAVHHDDPVGDVGDDRQVVGDEDDRRR